MSTALIHSQQILTASQPLTLVQRIAIIEQSADNVEREFYVIGQQLRVIRDTRQYEEGGYFSFEDFCERGIHRTKRRAYQLIQAALAVEKEGTTVHEISTVENEWQYRKLIQEQKPKPTEFLNNPATWDRPYKYTPESELTPAQRQIRDEWPRTEEPKPHVAHNSGNNEWYTPPEYIEAARTVLGSIDLDPASSDTANEIVKAKKYFTAENDGLKKDWRGRIWMNPPYAADLIGEFTSKLCAHLAFGDVAEAIVLVNNATETIWFQEMAAQAQAICFPKGRIRYLDSTGNPTGSPLQGQAFLYFGTQAEEFKRIFEQFGVVKR